MNEKLEHLEAIKDSITAEQYEEVATAIIINYYKKELRGRSLYLTRSDLLSRVNLTLRSLGIKEITYSYLRQFYPN